MSDAIVDAELNGFFNVFHDRLPQELHLMIYNELLTEDMMHEIAASASPTAYAYNTYPLNHTTFLYKPTPRFLKPRILDSGFTAEMVKAFYCKYNGSEAKHPLRIATLLQRDFFKLGYHIKLANCALRAFTVDGCLLSNNKRVLDVKLLPAHFAPLFQTQQRLATDFHLTIRLWTNDSSLGTVEENLAQRVSLRRILQALKTVFAELIEKQPTATHNVILEVARKHKSILDMELAEQSSTSLANTIYSLCL